MKRIDKIVFYVGILILLPMIIIGFIYAWHGVVLLLLSLTFIGSINVSAYYNDVYKWNHGIDSDTGEAWIHVKTEYEEDIGHTSEFNSSKNRIFISHIDVDILKKECKSNN